MTRITTIPKHHRLENEIFAMCIFVQCTHSSHAFIVDWRQSNAYKLLYIIQIKPHVTACFWWAPKRGNGSTCHVVVQCPLNVFFRLSACYAETIEKNVQLSSNLSWFIERNLDVNEAGDGRKRNLYLKEMELCVKSKQKSTLNRIDWNQCTR